MNLKDKSVLITGAGTGIGQAIGLELIKEGAKIISFDIKSDKKPSNYWTDFNVDITKNEEIQKAVQKIQNPIDILINNAGIMRRGKLLESLEDDFDAIFAVNVKGAWLVLKNLLHKLQPNATIVQMSSRHALHLPIDPALYGLSKRMMMDMGEVIAKTYPSFNVKILCPGPVDTKLTHTGVSEEEMERKRKIMTKPEAIAKKTVQLLKSDTKSRLVFDIKTSTYFLE